MITEVQRRWTQLYCRINKNNHINLNALIYENNFEINGPKKLSGHKNEFDLAIDNKSIQLWSYSVPYIPGVFSYDENCAIEEHRESDIASDAELLVGDIGGEDESDEYDDIMDEDLDVNKLAFADAPGV